jgi:hypothetical protein
MPHVTKDRIVDTLIEFAQSHLKKLGGFHPFAIALATDSGSRIVVSDTGEDFMDVGGENSDHSQGEVWPLARLAAVTPVAGIPILLQFLVFPPATRLDFPDPALTEELGAKPDSGVLWKEPVASSLSLSASSRWAWVLE